MAKRQSVLDLFPPPPVVPKNLLSRTQTARKLGISPTQVSRLESNGKLPSHRISNGFKTMSWFEPADIERVRPYLRQRNAGAAVFAEDGLLLAPPTVDELRSLGLGSSTGLTASELVAGVRQIRDRERATRQQLRALGRELAELRSLPRLAGELHPPISQEGDQGHFHNMARTETVALRVHDELGVDVRKDRNRKASAHARAAR